MQQRAITALLQASFAFRLAALMLDRRRPDLAAAVDVLRCERDTALDAQQVAGFAERQAIRFQARLRPFHTGLRQEGARGAQRQGLPFRAASAEIAGRGSKGDGGAVPRRPLRPPSRKPTRSPKQPLPGA